MSIVQRAKPDENPIHVALGILVLVASVVAFGLVNIQILNETIEPYAGWIFVGGFVMIYFLSDRAVGDLEDYELGAFLIPVLSVVTMQVIPQFGDMVESFHPYSSFVLFAITVIGYYVLSTNMRLGIVAFQLIMGGILVTTAAVQFNIIQLDIVGNSVDDVAVWVFLLTLAAAYMLSEHTVTKMKTSEIMAIVVGAGSYVLYTYAPAFSDFVNAYNPISGIVLTIIVLIAYIFIMRNGQLRS